MKTFSGRTRIRGSVVFVAIMIASLAMSGCETIPRFTGEKGLKANPYIVAIKFDAEDRCKILGVDEEATPCETGEFCVDRNQWIVWHSEPAGISYKISFDPTSKYPLKSWSNGYTIRKIGKKAPIANYKYSIVRDGCEPNEKNTLDPHIRVNN